MIYMLLDFHVKTGTSYSLRDKRLFEISQVEITRVDRMSSITVIFDTENKSNLRYYQILVKI